MNVPLQYFEDVAAAIEERRPFWLSADLSADQRDGLFAEVAREWGDNWELEDGEVIRPLTPGERLLKRMSPTARAGA